MFLYQFMIQDSLIIPSEVNLTSDNAQQVVLSKNDSGFVVVFKR